jgi:hypothetical protein
MDWVDIATDLPGKTFHAAMALWWLHGLSKGAPVRFTSTAYKRFKLDRGTAAAGLARLEGAGLVRVSRQPGRCPVVTILPVPESGEVAAGGDFDNKPA